MKGLIKITIFILGSVGLGYALFATIPDFSSWAYLWIILTGLWLGVWIIGIVSHRDFIKKEKAKAKIESIPLLVETVSVVSKLHEKSVGGSVGITETTHSYFIAFEFSDKRRIKFAVNANQYALVREGESGVLSYRNLDGIPKSKGFMFVDFQPQ